MNWLGIKNGPLLQLMIKNEFTTFITFDNNLSFQQNFRHYPICVVVLIAKDNTYETITAFPPAVIEKVKSVYSGAHTVVHPEY